MAVVKEYLCPGHGPFESTMARCPRGCTVVAEREFRTAPAYHSGKTARTDEMLRSQVEAFGLSDIRSARTGETARKTAPVDKYAAMREAIKNKYPTPFAALPKGGTFNAHTRSVENADRGAGAEAALAAHHAEGTGAIKDVQGKKHGYTYVRDPENVKVDVSKAA